MVKASTLRDYGVDNFFFIENKNTDTSQRNVVFIARGESARNAHAIAGEATLDTTPSIRATSFRLDECSAFESPIKW